MATDPQSSVFPEAQQFLRSHNHTTFKNRPEPPAKTADEDLTRYFISSWDETDKSPQAMARFIQAHWCCESRHWQRDACWREDQCLLRNPNAACALALVRSTLQSLLSWAGRKSLPTVFEDVAHDLSTALDLLKSRRLRP